MTSSNDGTRVSVFGLGYVGAVSCGCLANDGHEVIGVDLNPANLIALPLLLGVGIDTAVHVVHRAQHSQGEALIATSLGRALIYSGLTSIASFGSLALGSHPGTASIGEAISIGILCCVLAGLIVAPALWRLSER